MLNNLSANISESVLATIASSEFTIDLLDLKQQTWQRFDTVSEGALDALKVRGQVALSSDLLRYLFNCVEDKPPGFFGVSTIHHQPAWSNTVLTLSLSKVYRKRRFV